MPYANQLEDPFARKARGLSPAGLRWVHVREKGLRSREGTEPQRVLCGQLVSSIQDGGKFGIAGTQRIYVYSEANGKVYELVKGDCKEEKYEKLHHFILGSGTFDASTYKVVYK